MDITYAFGTGDGELTEWSTPAGLDVDGDGTVDAVELDFDGDGLIDDAMWDSDADGVADTTCLDVADGAGGGERWFVDATGDGTWATEIPVERGAGGPGGPQTPAERDRVVGTAGGPDHPGAGAGRGGDGSSGRQHDGRLLVDSDGDGVPDTQLADSDGDGYLDTAAPAITPPAAPPPLSEGSGSAAMAMLSGLAAVSGAGSGGTGSWGVGVR
ncbi:hypothetical protein [Tomitella cavernea]|uniref:EF-hand domain-containing protein n=1 Tax=Tomitella cavernea TaxID=1387982 RepID=A0ABP9BYU7_9ACTN|nr:hypothetical protein [Tomitella cavernea]